jgi:transposase InsO family protein
MSMKLGVAACFGRMQLTMQNAEHLNQEQIQEFLESSAEIEFAGRGRAEIYAWTERVMVAQEFARLSRKERGLIRAYIGKMTGLSPAQITRLIRTYLDSGSVQERLYHRHQFARHYTDADIALLAEVDRAHERLNGTATRRILEREYLEFGKQEFRRMAGISVSHLYNLRQSARYRKRAAVFEATRPSPVAIGERRKPDPQGRPGFLRVDTVHQGDWDGAKGVYHINAVDTVTQWQIVGCTSKISEQFLLPVLEAILHQFPFQIIGFHADNGSEYINHRVAELLNKLVIEFTKSRACRSQDNALVEGKNGAVVRKLIGYGYIAGEHAEALQKFYTAYLNPYLNYHRPCGFATVSLDARGKRQRRYKAADYATPYEKLKSLPEAAKCLKAGISFEQQDVFAAAMSDTECARKMTTAKARLLRRCKSESPIPPRSF